MSTWDHMSSADYAACVDAGRGPGRDVRHEADQARKERREYSVNPLTGQTYDKDHPRYREFLQIEKSSADDSGHANGPTGLICPECESEQVREDDHVLNADYAACVDAGRGEPRDVRDEADQARKEAREGFRWEPETGPYCKLCAAKLYRWSGSTVWRDGDGWTETRDHMHEVAGLAPAAVAAPIHASTPSFAGAGPCILCQRPTVGSVRGEPMCGECEDQMARDLRGQL